MYFIEEIFYPEIYACGKHNHNMHKKIEYKGISDIIIIRKHTTHKIKEKQTQ